jgi:hypothetical protein
MKVSVSSVASIDSRRLIYQHEVAKIAMELAGKKTVVELDPSATVGELVLAASTAFAFPESLNIQTAYLVIGAQPIEDSVRLSELPIKEDEDVQVRFVVIVY